MDNGINYRTLFAGSYLYTDYERCKTCLPTCLSNCGALPFASFDTGGNLLVPSSDPNYWANILPPSSIHTIPCCYDVSIRGIANQDPNQSWCADCTNLNIDLKHPPLDPQIPSYFDPYTSNTIVSTKLCNHVQAKDVCHYDSITIEVVIGLGSGTYLIDGSVYPSGTDYTYYYKYKDIENRPDLYIIAITTLHSNYSTSYAGDSGGYDAQFKTILGLYKGDYTVNFSPYWGTISHISPLTYSSDCNIKPNHGDFDGRNLSFDVIGSRDFVPSGILIHSSDVFNRLHPTYAVCNYDNMIISVRPSEEACADPNGIPFYAQTRDMYVDDHGFVQRVLTDTSGNVIYDKNGGVFPYPIPLSGIKGAIWLTGQEVAGWSTGYYFQQIPMPSSDFGGSLSKTLYVAINGAESWQKDVPFEESTRSTCYDTHKLNATHELKYSSTNSSFNIYDSNYWSYGGYYLAVDGHYAAIATAMTYAKDINAICCECTDEVASGCIDNITATLSSTSGYYGTDTLYYESILDINIAGNIFRHYYGNLGIDRPTPIDIDGTIVNPVLYYENPINSGIHNFKNATITASFGNNQTISCLLDPEPCTHCYDHNGPDNIVVDLSNLDWILQDYYCYNDTINCGTHPAWPNPSIFCYVNNTAFRCNASSDQWEIGCACVPADDPVVLSCYYYSGSTLVAYPDIHNCSQCANSLCTIYQQQRDAYNLTPQEYCGNLFDSTEFILNRSSWNGWWYWGWGAGVNHTDCLWGYTDPNINRGCYGYQILYEITNYSYEQTDGSYVEAVTILAPGGPWDGQRYHELRYERKIVPYDGVSVSGDPLYIDCTSPRTLHEVSRPSWWIGGYYLPASGGTITVRGL